MILIYKQRIQGGEVAVVYYKRIILLLICRKWEKNKNLSWTSLFCTRFEPGASI